MSILVDQLSKSYGKQQAVNAISFEIPSGQIVGFLGPNGAGKSTTMKMLTSFILPSSGRAEVNGHDVVQESKEVRSRIGYLPEHNPLYSDMYVREYLAFMAKLSGLKKGVKARVEELIDLTGLRPECKKKIQELSKGYRQRVGLAQAMIHDPEVLILDEPTSGLDPNQITEIRKLITNLGSDKTVLLSTHIMQEVEAMCDRVIIIDKGEIVADDLLTDLHKKASSQKVLKIKFKNAIQVDELRKLSSVKQLKVISDSEILISASEDEAVEEQIFNFAVKSKNMILEQKQEEDSLEDIFRKLTGN